MIRKRIATTLGFGIVVFCLCALVQAQDVKYNFAPGVDWAKFKTYRWVEVEGGAKPSALVNDQIIQAVDGQLASKGLTKTEGDNPDLLITYQVAVNEEKQWNSTNFGGYGYGPGTAAGVARGARQRAPPRPSKSERSLSISMTHRQRSTSGAGTQRRL